MGELLASLVTYQEVSIQALTDMTWATPCPHTLLDLECPRYSINTGLCNAGVGQALKAVLQESEPGVVCSDTQLSVLLRMVDLWMHGSTDLVAILPSVEEGCRVY